MIVEHDLVAALRSIPDEARGWQTAKTSVQCRSCHAISVFDPDKIGRRCDFCGSTELVPYSEVKEPFRPESLLPMKISESEARDLIRAWYGRLRLAPARLQSAALTDTVKGIYLPYWTFDADVRSNWKADAGTYHYAGRQRHIRWKPAWGEQSEYFDDQLVPGSVGVNPDWLHAVEPFPTRDLIPYDAGYLAGWTVERYQIDLVAAASLSRQRMQTQMHRLCAEDVPGDTYRNLTVRTVFSNQRFKHILVPVWLLTYTYSGKPYQVVINGVTGRLAGGRPWDWNKILLLVLLGLIFLFAYLLVVVRP